MNERLTDITTKVVEIPTSPANNRSRVKRLYNKAEIGLSDALYELMFDYGMERGEALRYLGL